MCHAVEVSPDDHLPAHDFRRIGAERCRTGDTDDSAQALSYLKRFGSVSVLNGHIHQVMQKVEGHITFHTAMSTAFPQPAPGTAPSPGPMKVEADRLKKVLGLSRMSFHDVNHPIAITDVPLEESLKASAGDPVIIDAARSVDEGEDPRCVRAPQR